MAVDAKTTAFAAPDAHTNGVEAGANGTAKQTLTAAQKRRLRKKQSKAQQQAQREQGPQRPADAVAQTSSLGADVEYVSAPREYEAFVSSTGAATVEEPAESDTPELNGLGLGAADRPGLGASDPGGDDDAGTTAGLGSGTPGLGSTGGATAGLGAFTPAGLGSTGGDDEAEDGAGGSGTPGLGNFTPAGLGFSGSDGGGETPGLGSFQPAAEVKQESEDPYADFKRVFDAFATAEQVTGAVGESDSEDGGGDGEDAVVKQENEAADEALRAGASDDENDSDEENLPAGMSKKKLKQESRMAIAALKQVCPRPEVVEVWDVTSPDPRLLVWLKSLRNTAPVPRHWSQKRKYLQGKRGIEKPAFVLPDFIEATGIGEMRNAYKEKEDAKKLKQKQRDRMTGRMGKLDIDYQVLHDAFFKYQTKPHLSGMGEMYYEGKEFEARVKTAKPGLITSNLREALGMEEGAPPPWLINMQRYGPPPSYPELPVPGLNAPIPPGAQFGYQPGGWGKPPVNEDGIPLYGDVFAEHQLDDDDAEIDKAARWGDLESEEEESEEESEEEEEEGPEGEALADGIASGIASGITSGIASGYGSSLPSGIATPDVLDLRKSKDAGAPKQLYQVLEQQQAAVGAGLMGSDHTYKVPGAGDEPPLPPPPGGRKDRGGTDAGVAVDPEELEGLTEAEQQQLLEDRLRAQQQAAAGPREDFSDMVAAKAAQQKRKAAAKAADKNKKQKDSFRF